MVQKSLAGCVNSTMPFHQTVLNMKGQQNSPAAVPLKTREMERSLTVVRLTAAELLPTVFRLLISIHLGFIVKHKVEQLVVSFPEVI